MNQSRVRLGRCTMACFSVAGMHAVARMPTRVVCAVRNHARHTPRRTPTFRARRILFTSCQTARASAHRAVHLERPDTKARACSPRHAEAQALGDDAEERVYTFGIRSRWPSICSPQVRASLVLACLRFLLPKRRVLTKLFSLYEANLKHTVSLRRSTILWSRTMDEKGAHSALM